MEKYLKNPAVIAVTALCVVLVIFAFFRKSARRVVQQAADAGTNIYNTIVPPINPPEQTWPVYGGDRVYAAGDLPPAFAPTYMSLLMSPADMPGMAGYVGRVPVELGPITSSGGGFSYKPVTMCGCSNGC